MKWSIAPFSRFLLFFISGILFELQIPNLIPVSQLTLFVIVAIFFTYYILVNKFKFQYIPSLFGFFAFIFLFTTGIFVLRCKQDIPENDILNEKGNISSYIGIIKESTYNGNSNKCLIEISAVKIDNKWVRLTGKVLLHIKANKKLPLDGKILVAGSPKLIKDPLNNEDFNFRTFYANKQIYFQDYKSEDRIILIGIPETGWQNKIIFALRERAERIIETFIPFPENRVSTALILGDKSGLDPELKKAFSGTGTMHVLAVSGLHVGLIYYVLLIFTSFLLKLKRGRVIQAGIIIFCLWAYACITGLSPSVCRAATMFSFIVIGESFIRNTSILNSVSLSAFILLLLNPLNIKDVGFQLSYAAVIGIVTIQPSLKRLFESKYKAINAIWSLCCVTLAAQLATFPGTIFYFHQFPVYFLIANLVVIPLSTIIVYTTISLLVFSFIYPIGLILGKIISWLIIVVKYLIFFIDSLPFSTIQNITFNQPQILSIYFLIISFSAFLISRQLSWYKLAVISFALLLLSTSIVGYKEKSTKQMIVLHKKDRSVLMFKSGDNRLILTDTNKVINQMTVADIACGKLIVYNKTEIVLIDKKIPPSFSIRRELDILLLQKNAVKDLNEIKEMFKVKKIVLDGSNKDYLSKKILEQAAKSGVDCYYTGDKGAFVYDIL